MRPASTSGACRSVLFSIVLSCLAGFPSSLRAQQKAATTQGKMRTPQPPTFVRIPSAHKAAAAATMQKLYDIVLRDPGFREPIGYDMQPAARIDMPPKHGYTPIEYDVTGLMYWYRDEPGGGVRVLPVSMVAVYVFANNLDYFFHQTNKWQEDEEGPMYFEPPRQPDVRGFPSWGKGLAVVTRNERPIFVPVSRERAMRVVLSTSKKGLADTRAANQDPGLARMRTCLDKMEQELSALSPVERSSPAYLATTRVPGHDLLCDPFSSANDPNAQRIIAENPEFYDRSLPPTAIQVVLVNLSMLNTNLADQRGQMERIRDGLDVGALAALTGRP
jgi:hypothetical protein